MPRTKEQKYSYDKLYLQQNTTRVSLVFNKRKPDDLIIMEWLKTRAEGSNGYIKRLIRADMESSLAPEKP